MTPTDVIESVYRNVSTPALNLQYLATELRHWYQAFPKTNHLQPCIIGGRAALICQKHLSDTMPQAYRTLKAICTENGIYLKEDSRGEHSNPDFTDNRRKAAVILTFCLTIAANFPENAFAATSRIESQTVSVAFKNQTLSDVANKIAAQTGMRFKFDAAVENDMINKKLAAPNWNSAVDQLLQSYNYTTIQEGNVIKTIFISGYKGGMKPSTETEVGPDLYSAPDTYPSQDVFDSETSIDITIPTEELANLPEDGEMMIDLPVGTFNIKQESMVALDDGTLSWVGIMDDETQFYRLYLTRSEDGEIIGNIYTPNGAYNIETVDGRSVMIEVNQASMR